MKKSFFIGIILISIIFRWLSNDKVYAASFNPEKQTEKFLTAVQKNDFKTIFEMTYYYQTELAQIRSNNPKALWQKLTAEYYEFKKNAFLGKKEESLTDAWIRFGGELFGTPTDPVENVRTLMNLLTLSSKWKVIESKKEKHYDQWSGRQFDIFVVYVSLGYKIIEESPLIGSKVLKEAILSFVLDATAGLYMRSSRVGKGDVYWGGDPSIDMRVARHLATHGLVNDSISILEALQGKETLNNEGKILLASLYFERVRKEAIVKYHSGYSGFDKYTNYNWKKDIDKAIALSPIFRNEWVAFLVVLMLENLNSEFGRYSGGEETVNYVAKVATDYSQGYPELEKMVYRQKFDLASIYISWAKASKLYQAYEEHIKKALSLLPGDESMKRLAAEAIKHLINKQVQEGGPYVDSNIRQAREFAESLGINLGP